MRISIIIPHYEARCDWFVGIYSKGLIRIVSGEWVDDDGHFAGPDLKERLDRLSKREEALEGIRKKREAAEFGVSRLSEAKL